MLLSNATTEPLPLDDGTDLACGKTVDLDPLELGGDGAELHPLAAHAYLTGRLRQVPDAEDEAQINVGDAQATRRRRARS